ncbi:MAG: DNA polymerase III subunit gamma/tau [Clostridia bacterium]|nr:DNA polymerase III subunit gamma/tau [Clostridia bacterium]
MSYVALYRKYRPDNFDGVIGQDHIVNTLKNQIATGKVSHAYLFCGTRGTGKTSTAKIFARAVNCIDSTDGNPCGKCHTCKRLAEANLDIIEMDAASNNGVDYARDIREKVQYPPQIGKYKVYIIDEVHMLSTGAFNALLKTLEEPPAHAMFILCTTEVHKIPATILSRCMRFDFRLAPTDVLASHVASIYDKEGKAYTKEAVFAIATAGEGSVRDSLSIADRCYSLGQGQLTYDDVMNVLGVSSRQGVSQLANAVLDNQAGAILQTVDSLVNQGKDIGRLCKDLQIHFRNVLVAKTCSNAKQLLCLPDDAFDAIMDAAKGATVNKLLYAIDCLARMEADLRFALSPLMLFEATLLRVGASTGEVDVEGLERRITRLEQQPKNLAADTMLVVDRTNFQSVWNGIKVELERQKYNVLVEIWKQIEAKLEGDTFVVVCQKGYYELIQSDYYNLLQEMLKRMVGLKFSLQLKQVKKDNVDQQLSSLGSNVQFSK